MPILFVTAKGEESDALLGLGLGADDYIRKPFGIRELLARVEAVLRRTEGLRVSQADQKDDTIVRFGNYVFDPCSHRLTTIHGAFIALSPTEYALLACLISHRGRALSRDDIMDEVWGYDTRVTSRSIDRFVTTLRKKIELDAARPQHIETIREFGYRFQG